MSEKRYTREGYLKENYHYFHLRDTAGAELDFHFHEFDKLVLLLGGRVDYALESIVYRCGPGTSCWCGITRSTRRWWTNPCPMSASSSISTASISTV